MQNQPTKKQLARIPRLYETEPIQMKDKFIYLHFIFPKCDWYMSEFDGDDTFFGFVILNDDLEMAEWGYISFEFLKAVNVYGHEVEVDPNWVIRRAGEIDRICEARGWN